MSIQIGVNFEYKGELSNFARDSFKTLTDMRNVLDTDVDEGHISYCIETGKHYVFNKNNAIDVETGRWRLLTENPEDLKSALDLKADKSELNTKVDKVEGKSLISNTEIERLKNVTNYNDTDVKTDIANIKTSLGNKLESKDLNNINAHVSNTSIHITADERIKWDAKIDDSDLVEYEKTRDVNAKLNNKANKTDLNTHTGNTDIHVTANDKQKWNNKLDNTALNGYATESFVTTKIAEAATSGKVDLTGYATTIEVNNKLASKADKTEIPDISNLATKDELSTHADNSSIHITASEKTAWNNKLDASALDAYTTTDDLNSALALKANKDELFSGDYNDLQNLPAIPDTSNFATKGQLDGHISNATIHVTADEKTKVGKIKTDGNGKEFLANNGNYVGIYSKKEIDDLLYPILNPYKAPIVNLSASGTLFKVGTTNSVTFTANITKGRDDIKSIKFVNGTGTILKEITDKAELAKTTQTHTLSMTTTGTVKVIVNDGTSAVEKSVTVTYTYNSYYGIISADKTSLTSNEIKSLNKKLTIDKSFKYDKINLNNQKIAYAYLKSRGALTKILDANNFDYLNSYTRSEVNIDGQEYYLYILTKATIIDGFEQIYQ